MATWQGGGSDVGMRWRADMAWQRAQGHSGAWACQLAEAMGHGSGKEVAKRDCLDTANSVAQVRQRGTAGIVDDEPRSC